MKVELRLPQSGVDANIEVFDANGELIETAIGRIVIEPLFSSPTQQVTFLYGRNYVEHMEEPCVEVATCPDIMEEDISRFIAQVSGATGKARLSDRSKQVQPEFEAKRVAGQEQPVEEVGEARLTDKTKSRSNKPSAGDDDLASLPIAK